MMTAMNLFLILTFVFSTLFCFLDPLKFSGDFSLLFIFCFFLVLYFYYLITKKNKKINTVTYIVIILYIIFAFPNLLQGFISVANTIIKAYNEHSKYNFLPLQADFYKPPVLNCIYFLTISSIPFIYSCVYSVIHKQRLWIPFLFSFIYVGIPLLFNVEGNRIFIVFYLASCVTLLMYRAFRKQNTQSTRAIPIFIFTACLCSLQVFQFYFPQKSYQRDPVIEQMRVNFSQKGLIFFQDLFNQRHPERSSLNNTGNRYYSGKTDLTVHANEPTSALLKGISYMTYEQNEWRNPKEDATMIDKENGSINISNPYILEQFSEQKKMTIENTSSLNDFMYTPYYLDSINAIPKDTMKGFYIEADSSTYNLIYNQIDLTHLDEFTRYDPVYYQFVQSNYLQIPDTTREFLLNYFGDFTNSFDSLQDKVNKVIDIVENCADYTLLPGPFPGDIDFIEYFLQVNKRGYCVHFATTATMMLRAIGIPARYVEGYQLNSSDFDQGVARIKDSQAHAWMEVYYPNFGWVPYDVTPAAHYADTPIEEQPEVTTPLENEDTPTPNDPNTPEQGPLDQTDVSDENKNNSYYNLLLLPGGLILYYLFRYGFKRYLHPKNNNLKVIRHYQSLIRLTSTIDPNLYQLVLKARFSYHHITDDEIKTMKTYYKQTLEETKRKSSPIKKLWIFLIYL